MCVPKWIWENICVTAYKLEESEDILGESVLSFRHGSFRDWTHILRLCGEWHHPLSYLAGLDLVSILSLFFCKLLLLSPVLSDDLLWISVLKFSLQIHSQLMLIKSVYLLSTKLWNIRIAEIKIVMLFPHLPSHTMFGIFVIWLQYTQFPMRKLKIIP